MNREFDESLKRMLVSELDTVEMAEEEDRRVLAGIHQQIKERSNVMKFPKRKLIVAIVAAVAVTGTITAVAAGKIVGLSSGTNRNEAVYTAAEMEQLAQKHLDAKIHIAKELSDGSVFQEGNISKVKGVDETGSTVISYPRVSARYSSDGLIFLSIERLAAGIPKDTSPNLKEETYHGIVLGAREDQYLFLPPDASPGEEDRKLEAEGKLYISYGSSEVERKTFRNVHWEKDGITYLLNTFEDKSLDELFQMAKDFLDEAQ